jgi:hypothetical protein
MRNLLKRIPFILLVFGTVAGCDSGDIKREPFVSSRERPYKDMGRLFGDEGIDLKKLFTVSKDKQEISLSQDQASSIEEAPKVTSPITQSGPNPYLFRAALQVLKPMTIQDIQIKSGMMETAWYSKTSGERVRIVAFIGSGQIISSQLKLEALYQTRSKNANWKAAPTPIKMVQMLRTKILKTASNLRASDL